MFLRFLLISGGIRMSSELGIFLKIFFGGLVGNFFCFDLFS